MSFYIPITTKIEKIPAIIYPMSGIENLLARQQHDSVLFHAYKLYNKYSDLQKGSYHILIIWSDGKDIMTDVWLFLEMESLDAGYTVDCKTFRNLEIEQSDGISASDGLIMLGREAELEENLRKAGKTVGEYVFGERPVLPNGISNGEIYQL